MKNMLVVCTLMWLGCKKQSNFLPVYDVPVKFQPYIDSFLKEAANRRYAYSINNLIIEYDTTLTAAYCAKSNVISAENNVQKIISINPNITCWQNNVQLETLIFHELGHCFLGRGHGNTLLPNGNPKSIMIKDDLTIYSTCIYSLGDSCDKDIEELITWTNYLM